MNKPMIAPNTAQKFLALVDNCHVLANAKDIMCPNSNISSMPPAQMNRNRMI